MTKQNAIKIIEILKELYPDAKCSLDFNTPFEMLVAVCLSAQCTDERVNKTTPSIFAKYDTPQDFANADIHELEELVHPCGFYKNKAKNLKLAGEKIMKDFNGIVPQTMEELMTIPGVGRKSANLIMGDVFGKPAIVTDTHCIRLSNRIGLVDGIKEPKKVEMALWKLIPPEEGSDFCHRLVIHGREICTARTSPYCHRCCLNDICEKNGVEKENGK